MEKISNVAYAVIALLVMVVIIATVAIPVIETQISSTNEYDDNADALVTYSKSTSFQITFNDMSIGIISPIGQVDDGYTIDGTKPVVISDKVAVFSQSSVIVLYGVVTGDNDFNWVVLDVDDKITYSNGVLTYKDYSENKTYTANVSTAYLMDDSQAETHGDYGAWADSSLSIYVNPESKIYYAAAGYTAGTPATTGGATIASGTLADMDVGFAMNSSAQVVTTATVTATHAASEYYADELTGFTVTNSYNTGGFVVAPLEYIVEKDMGTNSLLLSIVPVMLLMVPIMFCIKIFAGRSD